MDAEIEFLSDNNNEFSSDPNPYAFPYFHANEIPVLYKTVNGFLSLCNNQNLSPQAKSLLLHKSAKKIIDRCQAFPKESGWVDSCGENALMKICQLVRFHRSSTTTMTASTGRTKTTMSMSTTQQQHLREQRQNQLIIDIAAALIKAEPRASFTVNNWSETPLHQFVAHCGWEQKHISNDTLIHGHAGHGHEHPIQSPKMQGNHPHTSSHDSHDGPSISFLQTLIHSSPQSVFTENYEKALPLHEVCTLSQTEKTYVGFPYSSLTIDSIMQSNKFNHFLEEDIMSQNHVQIIQAIATIYPKGFLRLDLKKRSPLYRAVESPHCSAEVVIYILKEMEKLFDSVEVDSDETMIPTLMRRAILGLKEKSSQEDEHSEVDTAIHQSFGSMQLTCKIASPLAGLWDALLLPRQKPSSWNIDINDTTISSDSNTVSLSILMAKSASSQSKARDMANRMGYMWRKCMLLMCSSYHGSVKYIVDKDDSLWFPLHAAIALSAPMGVVQLLTKLYPDDISRLHHVRDLGVTPITFALATIKHLKKTWYKEDYGDEQEERLFLRDTIGTLLGNDGSIPNSEGRLPLHLAIENGLGWNEGTAEIYKAYPDAVSVRDPVTGVFPFLAAASQCNCDDDIITLSNCYLLLKTDPSVLVSCYPYHE